MQSHMNATLHVFLLAANLIAYAMTSATHTNIFIFDGIFSCICKQISIFNIPLIVWYS